jgi:TRAP-type C4-dicarboxylate transport system permease small subunit
VLVLQLFLCVWVTALGIWASIGPKRSQRVVNTQYALLPEVRRSWQVTPVFLRLIGIFFVWYGYTLAIVYREELLFLAHFIRCSFACDSKGGDEAVGLT